MTEAQKNLRQHNIAIGELLSGANAEAKKVLRKYRPDAYIGCRKKNDLVLTPKKSKTRKKKDKSPPKNPQTPVDTNPGNDGEEEEEKEEEEDEEDADTEETSDAPCPQRYILDQMRDQQQEMQIQLTEMRAERQRQTLPGPPPVPPTAVAVPSTSHPPRADPHANASPTDSVHELQPYPDEIPPPAGNAGLQHKPTYSSLYILNGQGLSPKATSQSRWKIPLISDTLLNCPGSSVPFLAASESWLKSYIHDAQVDIPHYHILRCDRSSGTGGGTMLYVHDSVLTSDVQTFNDGEPGATIADINFTKEDIELAIDELDNYAATGHEDIPAKILKSCKHEISVP
ncbi:unnamed protein product [Gadus morhua 'NCC']